MSEPPDGGPLHPVEVKGWGEPIVHDPSTVLDEADIKTEQMQRAEADPHWRLEIVANRRHRGMAPHSELLP